MHQEKHFFLNECPCVGFSSWGLDDVYGAQMQLDILLSL